MDEASFLLFNADSARRVIVTAPHAKSPCADRKTGLLAWLVAQKSGVTALVGRTSRAFLDLNRAEANNHPFRLELGKLIEQKQKPLLVMNLHGTARPVVEVGSASGRTASRDVVALVLEVFKAHGLSAVADAHFRGALRGTIIGTFGRPDAGVHAVQLELPIRLREPDALDATAGMLAEIAQAFEEKFAPAKNSKPSF